MSEMLMGGFLGGFIALFIFWVVSVELRLKCGLEHREILSKRIDQLITGGKV